MTRRSGRDRETARQTPTAGPLGATNVQQALDLIAAAGPFFTTQEISPFALSAAFAPVITLSLAPGSTRKFFGLLHVTGGTAPAPTSTSFLFLATAIRTSGGVTTVSSLPILLANQNISGFNERWVVSGVDVALEIRASTADSVRLTIQYIWLEQLPV